MSTDSPTEAQRRMTSFIIHVYVPTFLEIRQRNLLEEGSRHLLSLITRVKDTCTQDEVNLLTPHIQFNGYCAQYELVLVSLLASQDRVERQLALDIIKQQRGKEKNYKRKTIRKVKNPQVNMAARSLSQMVDIHNAPSTPPILFHYSDQELAQFLQVPYSSSNLPCTTTAVERGVKMTTEAATVVSGAWKQDEVTWNRVEARKRNKYRAKKADFQV